jgi:hypothetical protein
MAVQVMLMLRPCLVFVAWTQVVARGAADLDAALKFAAAIGAKHLCGVIYSALAKYPGPPTAQGRNNCAREIRKLSAKAADQGIRVCLEVVNRCHQQQRLSPAPADAGSFSEACLRLSGLIRIGIAAQLAAFLAAVQQSRKVHSCLAAALRAKQSSCCARRF